MADNTRIWRGGGRRQRITNPLKGYKEYETMQFLLPSGSPPPPLPMTNKVMGLKVIHSKTWKLANLERSIEILDFGVSKLEPSGTKVIALEEFVSHQGALHHEVLSYQLINPVSSHVYRPDYRREEYIDYNSELLPTDLSWPPVYSLTYRYEKEERTQSLVWDTHIKRKTCVTTVWPSVHMNCVSTIQNNLVTIFADLS